MAKEESSQTNAAADKQSYPSDFSKGTDCDRRANQAQRLDRTLHVLELISGHRRWDPEGLAKELQCDKRTIHRALAQLELAGVNWEFDKKADGYRVKNSRLPVFVRHSGASTPRNEEKPAAVADSVPAQNDEGKPRIDVEVEFTQTGAPFVDGFEYLSTGQVQRHEDGSAIVKFTVKDFDEIVEFITVFWSGFAKVVGPPEIRHEVIARLRKVLDLHLSPSSPDRS